MSQPPVQGNSMLDDIAVCTLFEGDYHLGLAAFLNSLVRAGYRGTVWAGYRGTLPPWVSQLKLIESNNTDRYHVADDVTIVFVNLITNIHLANYKPQFMIDLFANHARDCRYLWYFDPDILLLMSWSYFANWQRFGVALCQEVVDNILPADAPLRQEWMELARRLGPINPRPLDHYYNSGMVGVPSEHKELLTEWKRMIELAVSLGCDPTILGYGSRESPFNQIDQDALNAAVMCTKCPLTTVGPQGMGFIFGASMAMYHAVGPKPWRVSFLLRALEGLPPSGAMKCFLAHAGGPIRAYGTVRLRAKQLACSLASLIGRFYRRP